MEHELSKEQIISITTNETGVEDADNVVAVFYRSLPPKNSLPITQFQKKIYNNDKSWSELIEELKAESAKEIISVCQTPKSVGGKRQQALCFSSTPKVEQTYLFKGLTSSAQGEGFPSFVLAVTDWLNKNVAPHQLVSVSLFENDHPNDKTGEIHSTIAYKEGPLPS